MEEEIITKLKSALSEPIEKEKDVVYILVEIRKLLERKVIKPNYSVLNFYCNWVLHSSIEKIEPEIQSLLEKIEETFSSPNPNSSIPMRMLDFGLFKKDFQKFITDFSIVYNLDSNWITIRKLLIDIISDCPLRVKNGVVEEFNFTHSKNYREAGCIIKFRNKTPDRINIRFRFHNF